MPVSAEGVLAGVMISGDDVSFRYLGSENEKNGHPLTLLTGHEIVVDGALLVQTVRSWSCYAEPEGYVRVEGSSGRHRRGQRERDRLDEISHLLMSPVRSGYGAAGAFKCT